MSPLPPFLAYLFAQAWAPLSHAWAPFSHASPALLGYTLAGIALGLLALRLLDGRPAPFFFQLSALGVAGLALAHVGGFVALDWPLGLAGGAVLLLLAQEGVLLLNRLLDSLTPFETAGGRAGPRAPRPS